MILIIIHGSELTGTPADMSVLGFMMVVSWCSRSGDCSNSSGAFRFITSSSNSAFELGTPYHVFGSPLITLHSVTTTLNNIPDAVRLLGKNGWVSRCQENSYSTSPEWLEKADRTSSYLLVGDYEDSSIISQCPQCGRCHQAGTGQATLEVIGSKRSCALKWCKPNNDDDDVTTLKQQ